MLMPHHLCVLQRLLKGCHMPTLDQALQDAGVVMHQHVEQAFNGEPEEMSKHVLQNATAGARTVAER